MDKVFLGFHTFSQSPKCWNM